jgi:hypothetical protein
MPTINQLPAATASAATDAFMCSQGGIARQSTLSQMLASTQPLIALTQGQLLGRFDAGAGPIQPVVLGTGLAMVNGTLTAAGPFEISGLPAATVPTAANIVPLAQTGANVGATYAQFMSGLPNVTNINGSGLVAQASGAATARTLAALFTNAVAAEDFGAAGDGATDDTAALTAALAAGQPVRLGPKTYCISGQWTITGAAATLLGIPGQTTLRRLGQSGDGAWISVQSASFHADGIAFDANTTIAADTWAVLVTPGCLAADFHRCTFENARGTSMGCGLTFQAAYPAVTQHTVRACEAANNAVHGIWVQALLTVRVDGCRAHDNGAYGICVDYADPALVQKLEYCQVVNCAAWNNQRGISVGNFNATNATPPVWGNANPDAICILVAGNVCHDNSIYGIAAAGQALAVAGNQLANNGAPGGAGILANVGYSRVAGNVITGASQYGIDAGGSIFSDIAGNHVSGAVHGITPGGGQSVRVAGNMIQNCNGWAVLANNVETDGQGRNFGLACTDLAITDNWIGFSVASGGGGILLLDNPQNVLVARNCVVGSGAASIGQALWANTNAAVIVGNTWNVSPRATLATGTAPLGGNQIVYPDLLDEVLVTAASNPVSSLISLRQQALAGQLGFIAVTAGGTGYSGASVAISGDGAGAAAIAYVSNGAVIGIALTNAGSGYSHASVTITPTGNGAGSGATASAQIGLPSLEQRTLTVRCAAPVVFSGPASSAPAQQNWTDASFTVPANAEITFNARGGAWCASNVPLADYIVPSGTGGVMLTTQNAGDLVLSPGGAGHLRLATATEVTGATSSIGRGSPAGVVSAPPGSDFRNLNGGAGQTYWIKQTGTGSTGWIAVA